MFVLYSRCTLCSKSSNSTTAHSSPTFLFVFKICLSSTGISHVFLQSKSFICDGWVHLNVKLSSLWFCFLASDSLEGGTVDLGQRKKRRVFGTNTGGEWPRWLIFFLSFCFLSSFPCLLALYIKTLVFYLCLSYFCFLYCMSNESKLRA